MYHTKIAAIILILITTTLACNLLGTQAVDTPVPATEMPVLVEEPVTAEPVSPPVEEAPTADPPAPTATPESTTEPVPTEIVHTLTPLTFLPSDKPQVMYDQESIRKALEKQAYGGDEFLRGRFERPFDQAMTYIPYIDIKQANMVRNKDNEFIYGIIFLQDNPTLKANEPFGFGLELDKDADGRGDYLIWTRLPQSTDWSVEGVSVWKDANTSIGGEKPMLCDAPTRSDGYELKVFDAGVGEDPDLAWSRTSPDDPKKIEIAFKSAILETSPSFMWSAWAMLGADQFDRFDHNDYFTFAEAGSSMKSEPKYYPLKEMFALDNTCRSASGFLPKGNEPGLCPIPPKPKKESNCTPVEYCFNTGSQTICITVCQ